MSDTPPRESLHAIRRGNTFLEAIETAIQAGSGPSTVSSASTPRMLGPIPRPPVDPDASTRGSDSDSRSDMVVEAATTPRSKETTPRLSQSEFQPSPNAFARVPELSHGSSSSASSRDGPFYAVQLGSAESGVEPDTPRPDPRLPTVTPPPVSPFEDASASGSPQPANNLNNHLEGYNEDHVSTPYPSLEPTTASPPPLHNQPSLSSLRAAINPRPTVTVSITASPQATSREVVPDSLPERNEPPASTTAERFRRGIGRFLSRNDRGAEDLEMQVYRQRASVSDPRLLGSDGGRSQNALVRTGQLEQAARAGEAEQSEQSVQPEQSVQTELPAMGQTNQHNPWPERWTWIGCFVGAATLGTVMYVALMTGEKGK